jgi:hypothetical protein
MAHPARLRQGAQLLLEPCEGIAWNTEGATWGGHPPAQSSGLPASQPAKKRAEGEGQEKLPCGFGPARRLSLYCCCSPAAAAASDSAAHADAAAAAAPPLLHKSCTSALRAYPLAAARLHAHPAALPDRAAYLHFLVTPLTSVNKNLPPRPTQHTSPCAAAACSPAEIVLPAMPACFALSCMWVE